MQVDDESADISDVDTPLYTASMAAMSVGPIPAESLFMVTPRLPSVQGI